MHATFTFIVARDGDEQIGKCNLDGGFSSPTTEIYERLLRKTEGHSRRESDGETLRNRRNAVRNHETETRKTYR